MRVNDTVVLVKEIKASLDGQVIPEGAQGTILYKIMGSGRNSFEVDFGTYGIALCDKHDLKLSR